MVENRIYPLKVGVALAAWLTISVSLLAVTELRAQVGLETSTQSIKVGLYISPPFVMQNDHRYTGMAIELWEAVAAELNLEFDYAVRRTFDDLLKAVSSREVDVAVSNLTITRDRAEHMDFTHPWFDAGLRILINQDSNAGFLDIVTGLQKSGHLRAYFWIGLIILGSTIGLTLFDRFFDNEFTHEWHKGLAESFYHVMSVATSGRTSHKEIFGAFGRVLAALWMVCGVAILGYVTSSITSVMTTQALSNEIDSVADLPGKTVGVLTGSVAERYARNTALDARSYSNVGAAASALLGGRIAAIIGDAPVLEYYDHSYPDTPLTVVGAIFKPDKYGFGLTRDSKLTRKLTVEVLKAHESGLLERLRSKYFGVTP